MDYRKRMGTVAVLALVLLMVATPVLAAMPWTRISKLLVQDEAYVEGTLEVDGAMTLDGAITASGGIDLNGSALTIDADADTILDESADDVVGLTMGAAAGTFSVLTGNLKVGNGSPTVTQNGEDLYVESQLEVDDEAQFDGAIDANGTSDFAGAAVFNDTLDVNGTALYLGADKGIYMDEAADGDMRLIMGGATDVISFTVGSVAIGNGIPGEAQNGEDLYVESQLEVDGNVYFDNAVDFDSTIDVYGAATLGGGADLNGTQLTLGADAGIYMDELADGDYRFVMAAGTDVISFTVGNVAIGNGIPTSAQTGEDLYVEGMLEVDSVLYSDGNTYIGGNSYFSNNTIYADTDSDITIRGNSNDLALTTVAAGTVSVNTGNLKVGSGSPTIAQNGEDAFVTGQFEVDGEAQLDGALDANSTADFASTVAFNADVTMAADATGGDAGAKNEYIGLPRIKYAGVATGIDGSAEVVSYMDADPDAEWVETAHVTDTDDAAKYKGAAASLRIAWAADAVDDDGVVVDIANDDLEANESIGFWLMSDTALDAGDLSILIDDTDADTEFPVCAVATVNAWSWCEVNIGALAAGSGNVVDKVGIIMNDAAGLGAIVVNVQHMYKWDADNEEALADPILLDGVLGVVNTTTAGNLVEYTNYFTHYQSGADALVYIDNQSAATVTVLYAY